MNVHHTTTEFNCGIDLHARSMYVCVMDQPGNILLHRNIRNNDFDFFLTQVEPYRHSLTVACESTFNWYWICDACTDAGIEFALGHALYMSAIHGTKTKNDKVDSRKIADLLRANLLPWAYCCSAENRPVRDLLRKRIWLSQLKARLEGRMTAGVQVHGLEPLTRQEKRSGTRHLEAPRRYENPLLQLGLETDMRMAHAVDREIKDLENAILKHTRLTASTEYHQLQSVPGFGKILPLVVLYETDTIERFPTVRDFCSYALVTPPDCTSAGKTVGKQGRKMGNHYLKWAFVQGAIIAKRTGPISKYAESLTHKHGKRKANSILAHRLAIAVYYMLRNKTVFDYKLFLKGKVNLEQH